MTRRCSLAFLSGIAIHSIAATPAESGAPHVTSSYPTRVYWGDTHLHTSLSVDAYTFGSRLTPEDAYRFAKGAAVATSNGTRAKLRRPLDFLVIADHAESMGAMVGLAEKDPFLLNTDIGRRLSQRFEALPNARSARTWDDATTSGALKEMAAEIFYSTIISGHRSGIDTTFLRSIWERVIESAERHNDPGRFTAFIGYEWSAVNPGSIHRVLVFKDGADRTRQTVPFSAMDSREPELLWDYMRRYEQKTGGEVLAISHNGNLSKGAMFPVQMSRSQGEQRRRWEPLYEVAQTKGYSETHPLLSPADEFADAEIWNSDDGAILSMGQGSGEIERLQEEKRGEYARSAFKQGLKLQTELGINPFKFGLIGSTDAHTALSAVEEDNFWGVLPANSPGPDRAAADKATVTLPLSIAREIARRENSPEPLNRSWQLASSGYAAVWATENTREALFAAMKRRETYATTGPRMVVRFFGGWGFVPADTLKPDLARIGYTKGVPMGGDLTHAPSGKAPTFLIGAVKDPDGANLDRAQVIKGWLDSKGQTQEKIYNVALSDGRKETADGRAPPVGSTVNVAEATYANTIGDAQLAVVWRDPDFDARQPAFYYVRVIEIPTPRWTAYDAKRFGIKSASAQIPMVTQERAYTSPIWYEPSGSPR